MKAYSHRWHRPAVLASEPFNRVVADARIIVEALEKGGVRLCGPDGEEEPSLNSDIIALSGNHACGHAVNYRICRTRPADHAGGIAEPEQDVSLGPHGDTTLISMRACNGSCAYQGLYFSRTLDLKYADRVGADLFSGECATQFLPYDLCVTAILLSAKYHLRDTVRIFTDGTSAHFFDAQILCVQLLDFGFEFEIIAGEFVRKFSYCAENNIGENNAGESNAGENNATMI